MPDASLPNGIYERLLTRDLLARLTGLRHTITAVDEAEQADVLGEYVGRRVADALLRLPAEERVPKANALLALLGDTIVEPGPHVLMAAAQEEQPGVWKLLQTRPAVPLSRPALLTNASSDPKLGAELRAELVTADRVDLLCAFVKWYGLRVLEAELRELKTRDVPLRVLTTTYMGATDRTALDRLVRDFGAEVKVNYETQSTRLHAKAWLFRRASGYDTAYVGSSNLSRAALLDGLEWNVKLAGSHTPELLAKFEATFDSYWSDPAFVTYDPDTDADRLDQALAVAGGLQDRGTVTFSVSGLEVRPYPHQQEILDRLDVEREVHGRHRNLVIAATGTGKTVVAALDYARLPDRPSLLFVAHRQEILQQSLRTYREVLADGAFGELYVGGSTPERWRHVFASVQSLSSYGITRLAAEHFDIVVIDEFHHAEAATYRRLLDHLQPRELLGLTATPERTDGVDVRSMFGGRAAAELRLWDALENDLLCPFHYFGVSDATDLSQLDWRRGEYDVAALENVYTADDARVRIVLREVRDKVRDVSAMRALGFCVSVRHAEYMAERFTAAGIPSLAVSGKTSREERAAALQALRDRRVNVLFAVDLFNEGLDIPDVDTLLLLRPTQSATVFLQQLGRGLRRTADKPVLTVLDFIGQQRREFRFDLKYRALTGTSRSGLERQLERGFAFLPSGCELVLDEVARAVVLENVKRQLKLNRKELVQEIRNHGDLDLAEWLRESGRELTDVFRAGSWTALRRTAGLSTPAVGPADEQLLKRTAAFAHVDDVERATLYTLFLSEPVQYDQLAEREQRFARMLFFSLWPNGGGFTSYQRGFDLLAMSPAVCDDLRQVIALGLANAEHVSGPLEAGMQQVTMRSNAHYSREETLAALDWASLERKPSAFVAGVVWSEAVQTDAFFVTLRKSEQDYSPTTMYHDYAISPELFHWESQNATAVASPTGQRYVHHRQQGSHVLLLARETRSTEWKGPRPFLCLGPASYVSHEGERPIAITWRLRHPLPVDVFRRASVTA
ncbi:MAG: type restriction protein res subunit [Frankiales bacterium]|nr:type restriction protein res subunit [Frankiales bacterium]